MFKCRSLRSDPRRFVTERGHRKVTTMMACFMRFCVQPDIGSWNTECERVCKLYGALRFCVQRRHSKWEHRQVTTMYYMFYALLRSTEDIGSWDTAQVTTMYYMFYGASAFNQDIGDWNTAQVTICNLCFVTLLRSTKTLGVGTQRK